MSKIVSKTHTRIPFFTCRLGTSMRRQKGLWLGILSIRLSNIPLEEGANAAAEATREARITFFTMVVLLSSHQLFKQRWVLAVEAAKIARNLVSRSGRARETRTFQTLNSNDILSDTRIVLSIRQHFDLLITLLVSLLSATTARSTRKIET